MKLKKALNIVSYLVNYFVYSVAVTVVKKDADECKVYVDVHGKFSDELNPFLKNLDEHKLFWGIEDNGLLEIYDNSEEKQE
jgi:hypothetical protein